MPKSRTFFLGLLAALILATTQAEGGKTMQLASRAFTDGGKIPQQYVMPGAGGRNVSIPLSWTDPPGGTRSFALSIIDPHPIARHWVHWLVINIPAESNSLAEGASGKNMPPGAVELKNSFGQPGYGGPQPPPGTGDHPYVVTLYALKVAQLDLSPNTDRNTFEKTLEGKILASASLTGYYGR
ncbi:MAG: YbhB/YbcL family Raf kinase inhibitor-like protein [Thermodesulfobacteriota bacterium]